MISNVSTAGTAPAAVGSAGCTLQQNRRRFCHIFLEQSVSLSDWSTHSCNTRLLAWHSVWTNQKKVVKKSFPSSSNIFKPNSAPKGCDRIGAGFIATWGPWWFPSCHDAVISRKDPRSNVPAPATTSH